MRTIVQRIRRWSRWRRWVVGSTLILVSIPVMIIPLLNSWVLIIPGIIMLLGPDHRVSRWLVVKYHRTRAYFRYRRASSKTRRPDAPGSA